MDCVIQGNVLCKYHASTPNSYWQVRHARIPENVTEIGEAVFRDYYQLETVEIPESVTKIGRCAFYNSSLKSVTLPEGITEIEERAFSHCTKLQSVTLPKGVAKIGKAAFKGCYGLKSVTLPEGITEIGEKAFSYCKRLQSVTIPGSVAGIGESAFGNCTGLQSVTILANISEIGRTVFEGSYPDLIVAPHIPISGFKNRAVNACAGFAKLYCDQVPLSEEIRTGYLAYIKNYRKSLYAQAMEYLPLLQLMTAEKIILQEDFEELFGEALQKGNVEITALLLEYRHKNFNPVDLEREFELEEL